MTTLQQTPVITDDYIYDLLQYSPTAMQRRILEDNHKTQLVAGGFRGGKSRTASMKATLATLKFIAQHKDKAVGQVAWLVGETYEDTRAEFAHPDGSLLRDLQVFFGKSVRATSRVDPGYIRIPVPGEDGKSAGWFEIKTKSASDPASLGMESPVWIVLCEAAKTSYDTYLRLFSRVSEAQKRFPDFGWLHMEGTFEGSLGWYPALWKKWQSPSAQNEDNAISFSLPSHSNTVIYPKGEDDPGILRLKEQLPENVFAERHLGIPVPPSGRVHSPFSPPINVRTTKSDPSKPVFLGIDPGYSGQPSTYCVEVLQQEIIGEHEFTQWRLIDEIAINKHVMPGFTVKDVCDVAMGKYWWKNGSKHAVIDIAGARHADAQESNVETWRKLTGLLLRSERVNILPGIDRMDTCLKQDPISGEPGLIVDPRCKKFIAEMGAGPDPFDGETRAYMWATDKNNEVMGKVPADRYNDAIKAVTYLLVNVMGFATQNVERSTITVKSRRKSRRKRRREGDNVIIF